MRTNILTYIYISIYIFIYIYIYTPTHAHIHTHTHTYIHVVGPCHNGMAHSQVADRGTAFDMEGSWEYIE